MARKPAATTDEVKPDGKVETLSISAPKFNILELKIRGNADYVQLRFGVKARETMRNAQAAGSQAKKGKKKEAKDFTGLFEESMYATEEGWRGIPAAAFRIACVDSCRLTGFKMTHAKLGIFILADGNDKYDNTALVRITKGEPEHFEAPVRNATGVADIRVRAKWREWEAKLRVRYDADMFTAGDVANMIARVGMQLGIGEGRPNSKESCGMGWGTFDIVND